MDRNAKNEPMEDEIYYQMEAASGRTVRVPASRSEQWIKGQEAIARGEEPESCDEDLSELAGLLGIPDDSN